MENVSLCGEGFESTQGTGQVNGDTPRAVTTALLGIKDYLKMGEGCVKTRVCNKTPSRNRLFVVVSVKTAPPPILQGRGRRHVSLPRRARGSSDGWRVPLPVGGPPWEPAQGLLSLCSASPCQKALCAGPAPAPGSDRNQSPPRQPPQPHGAGRACWAPRKCAKGKCGRLSVSSRTHSEYEREYGGQPGCPHPSPSSSVSFPKGYHGTVFYCSFPGSFLQTSASVWARARLVCPPGRAGPLFELSRRGPSLWGRASERRFSDRRELGFLVACARWPGPGPASRAGQDPPAALVFLALRPCLVTTGTQATWATTEGAGWGNCKKAEGHHAECSSASFPPGVRRRAAVKALSTCRGL